MPEMPSYEPGAPSWVELASPDVRLSRRFYQGLFGWGSYTLTDAQVAAYEVFTLGGTADGPPIAGLDALADPAAEPTWTCYFRVVDAAAAAAAVVEAGGQVMAEPTDAGHLGRMVLAVDPEGAGFALWQPYTFPGAAVAREANTMCWVQLTCRDVAVVQRFYGHVLGWKEPTPITAVTGDLCYEWGSAGWPIASLVCPDESVADDTTSRWTPYFAVADCAAAAERAEQLGGAVISPCDQAAHGISALLAGPASVPFAIIELTG
jgi:predicted enzyme related to lactoylglutathione lyase